MNFNELSKIFTNSFVKSCSKYNNFKSLCEEANIRDSSTIEEMDSAIQAHTNYNSWLEFEQAGVNLFEEKLASEFKKNLGL